MTNQNSHFEHLQGKQFMSLTTFRKSGAAVATPVWFAEVDGRLYVTSQADAGKVKRIRHTARVLVAPSKVNGEVTGPSVEAVARILPAADYGLAETALKKKYGLQWWLFAGMRVFRRQPVERAYLEIALPA